MSDTATQPASAGEPVRDALRGDLPPNQEVNPGGGVGQSQQQSTPDQNQAPQSPQANQEAGALPDDFEPERSRVAPGLYKPLPERTIFEWRSASRPFKKRDRQFFVTVFVIALLVSLILFFSGQFLPIAVVISVVFLLYVLQVIPPHDINHSITTYGIHLEDNLYYWEEMGRFWFEEKYGQQVLSIETLRFPGRVTMIVPDENKPIVVEILSEVLLEQKPELSLYERVALWFQEKVPLE